MKILLLDKKKVLLFLLFIFCNTTIAQEFFNLNKTLYTKDSLVMIMNDKSKKNKQLKEKKLVYYYKPNRVDIKGDSIIHYGYLFVGSNYLDEPIYTLLNKPLSNLALEKYTGGIITNDSLIGKPTIIDLWYTNCAPCIKEIPILNKIKEKYGNSLHYKAITFENKKTIKRFLKKHNFTFDILINGQEFLDSMGNSSYPKLMVIDKDNIIRYLDLSIPEPENDFSNRYNEFIDLIDTLLKQKKT